MKINEIFYSIQGEGATSGAPTIFIRTAGCNLRCSYCDTTYAYEEGTQKTMDEILHYLSQYPCSQVCITGGEPLLQKDLSELILRLLRKKYHITIETNGSKSIKKLVGKKGISISLDIKCPSSGMQNHMVLHNLQYLTKKDQLKFIIRTQDDYRHAKDILEKHSPRCIVFFQPVWGTDPQKLASWILRDGLQVRLGVQLHKIIWGNKRGV